ncbi:MAG: S1C family serine protease [Anaerolineales bacterium]
MTRDAPGGLLDAIGPAITNLIDRVRPSVVQIHTRGRGAGAGVIWRSEGGILTNYHVVAHAGAKVQVVLSNGRQFDATITNTHPPLDLAMLRVETKNLPAAPVGDSSRLRVGELVFALGHPFGQPGVVTAGIVSGLGTIRVPHADQPASYIRSDVVLAPGNSGGPLLDAEGAVIGINAMILGGDLAVAIPSHVASEWVAGQPSHRLYL